jgi:hypothetical protein
LRGVVIPERRDEPEERTLWIPECGWSRDPHTGATAGRVAFELRIVAMISNARREDRIGCGLADHDPVGDRVRARGNTGDRRVVGGVDRRSLRRELVEGDGIC